MANHKSAAKRARQSVRKAAVNNRTRSTVRTFEKSLRLAISNKKAKEAGELLTKFMSQMDKAAQKGVVHLNNASRKVARLAKQVSELTK